MAKKIENKDLFASDFLQPQIKALQEMLKLIKSVEGEMKDVLKVQQESLKGGDNKSVKGLEQKKRAITKINQVSKEMLNLEKQRKKTSAQLQIVQTKEAKTLSDLRVRKQQLNKLNKDESLLQSKLTGAYKKTSIQLERMRKRYKDLAVSEKASSAEAKKLLVDITRLDKKLKAADAATGQFGRNVGNYPKVLGKATNALRSFGLAIGGVAIIRNITGIFRDFQQSQADLASVLANATKPQLEALTAQARELGATTRFTAGQISDLQKEFAKLGFEPEEIINMTQATQNLAAATGTDLAEAASVAGGTMNAFGLQSEDTARITDVMAASFSKSALDMEKFKETMKTAAPLAKVTGVSLEVATAAAGKLADANISGSKAGTDLKKIFSELVKDGKPFAQSLEDIANELEGATSKSEKLAIAEGLVGDRAKGALLILAEQKDGLKELATELENSGGAAQRMADTQLNTLNGAIDLLSSAWEGLVLDFSEGTGIFSGLQDVVLFLANNLKTIAKVMVVGTTAVLSYKVAMLAANAATKLMTIATKGYAIVQAIFTSGTKAMTTAMKAFNLAVKLNPIGLLVSVITAAITALTIFGNKTETAAERQARLNEKVKEGNDLAQKGLDKLKERTAEQLRLIDIEARTGQITDEEAQEKRLGSIKEQRQEIIKEHDELRELAITEAQAAEQRVIALQKEIAAEQEKFTITSKGVKLQTQATKDRIKDLSTDLSQTIKREQEKFALRKGIIDKLKEELKTVTDTQEEETTKQTEAEIEAAKKAAAERKRLDEEKEKNLAAMLIRLQDLEDAAIKDDEERQKAQIRRKFNREIDSIEDNAGVERDLRNALKRQLETELLKIEKEFAKKRAAEAFKTTQVIGQIEKEQNENKIKLLQEAADAELKKQLEIAAEKPEDVNIDELERLLNEKFDVLKTALENERDLLLLNEDLTAEERELINLKFTNKINENERNRAKVIDKVNDQVIEAQIATGEKIADLKKADEEADAELRRKQLEAAKNLTKEIIKQLDARTDRAIANIDKEIDASKKRQDELEALAAQGNLTAEQSVSAEIKRQADLERQKAALEKKKLRRKAFIEGLDLLSSKIDSGEKDAVTSTLNDMTKLIAALGALPGFYEGTETTVSDALGKPQLKTKKDAYVVRVDGTEKILNPALSARTGNATTEEIVAGYESSLNYDMLIHPKIAALSVPYQTNEDILRKFDSLERTIKEKPILSDLKYDDLSKALIVTVEENGNLKRTHLKLKK